MLNRIKALLKQTGLGQQATGRTFPEKDVAVAALLLEAAATDGSYDESEHVALKALIVRKMGLSPEDATALLDQGRARQQEAVELFKFADAAKRGMNEEERGGLVEMLWEVVYADGVLDEFEDRLIRSVAALLHVTDRARAEARQRVLTRRATGIH